MSDAIRTIGAAMRGDAEVVRVISQNIANADTVAYRREVPLVQGEFSELLAASERTPLAAETRVDVAYDMQPGALKSTGQPLDVALDGPGFFLLQSVDGTVVTRRGDFHLSNDGMLVAQNGAPVLGYGGPIRIGSGAAQIGSDGRIRVDGEEIDQLRIVQLRDESRLVARGDGTFQIDPQLTEEGERVATLRQGFLESSNVSSVNEMVQLMETLRHFELGQRYARAYDDLMGQAIKELGKTG